MTEQKKQPVEKKEPKPKAPKKVVGAVVVEEAKPKAAKKAGQVAVFDLTGKVVESISLPEIFNSKINKVLMTQAVRVYLANQRQGNASTLSRNEVSGSTRKIYRQKGTGRARHGSKKAPIFIHGGIAHGPKPVDHSLTLSKNMRRAALRSALTAKAQAQEIIIVSGVEAVEPKTKIIASMLKALKVEKSKVLFVMPKHLETVYKATRNIDSLILTAADKLNTYEVLNNKKIIFMKEAIKEIGVRD